jgi:tRNA/tmRNA/rRNA uracil-C5-methylase (TrmA/RlmC/RlmD family)
VIAERLELEIGHVATGGHFIAHAPDGRVVFVRHTLPGELVLAEITEEQKGFLRADAVEVLRAAPARVAAPCPYAGRCGGCDFQHVDPEEQRALKGAVLVEQLRRLGGLENPPEVRVEPLPGGMTGWRTRVRYTVDAAGRAGLLAYRSHEVVPVDRCLIATPAIQEAEVTGWEWPDDDWVEVVSPAGGEVTLVGSDGVISGPEEVTERVGEREYPLDPTGFWQIHPAAAEVLAGAVGTMASCRTNDRVWDLYGGAGLFAAALAPDVAAVTLVEADRRGVAAARRSLADLPNVHIEQSTVERFVARRGLARPDVIIVDPPRAGAGGRVLRALAAVQPRVIIYVSCDPAAFGRDVATLRELGWNLSDLRAFDAFPMTHHVESVGLFTANRSA